MESKTLTYFMKSCINEFEIQGRYGTAHVYRSVLKSITAYEGREVAFSSLGYVWLTAYEAYLLRRQLQWNTISTYMRVIRAVYNRAVDCKLAPLIPHLFKHVFTGRSTNHQRALTSEEMKKLTRSDLIVPESSSDKKKLFKEVNWARACLELMLRFHGMPFVDLVHLRKSDLNGNYLVLRRRKTGRQLTVRVSGQALELMKPYLNTDPGSPYLLNFLDGKLTGAEVYQAYQRLLRLFNLNLSRLASLCMVYKKVTSYCARHTWATAGKYCHIPIEVISEALGHASVTTTEGYMKSFENDKVKDANDKIMYYIYGETEKTGCKK